MYNWVTTRKIARTDGSTYPAFAAQTVDAIVAKWIPVTAALLACAVTPARPKLDVRQYEWQPSFAWVTKVVDTTVRTYIPATSGELQQSYLTAARQPLDVRRYEWAPESFDLVTRVDAQVRTWGPAFSSELASRRTDGRRLLDVRGYDWAPNESSWIFKNLPPAGPTVAQTWPAFQEATLSGGRTADGPRLDVRRYEWAPEAFDVITRVDAQVKTWVPAFTDDGYRTSGNRPLDVRSYEWASDEASWIQATQTQAPTVAQTAPAWTSELQSFRTPNRPLLQRPYTQDVPDIFGVPDDWITWVPAQDDGGLTRDRARLDVRAYEWGQPAWIFTSLPVATTDAQKWPGILDKCQSYRTPARRSLDVRLYDWSPSQAWIFASLPTVPDATVAQQAAIWPTALNFRTKERGGDVRNVDTQPTFTWVQSVVNAAIAPLAPVFSAELASFRTKDDPRLDVRIYAWAPDAAAWELINFAPPVTVPQMWPALQENLGTQFVTPARAKLDVRAYDWQPEFTWASKVVDATVAKWISVFDAEISFRTPDRPRLDVRRITDTPEIWLFATLPPNVPLTTKIYLVGSYRPIISVSGSYRQTIALVGSAEPIIGLIGGVEP